MRSGSRNVERKAGGTNSLLVAVAFFDLVGNLLKGPADSVHPIVVTQATRLRALLDIDDRDDLLLADLSLHQMSHHVDEQRIRRPVPDCAMLGPELAEKRFRQCFELVGETLHRVQCTLRAHALRLVGVGVVAARPQPINDCVDRPPALKMQLELVFELVKTSLNGASLRSEVAKVLRMLDKLTGRLAPRGLACQVVVKDEEGAGVGAWPAPVLFAWLRMVKAWR
jgi:hypothetical protein